MNPVLYVNSLFEKKSANSSVDPEPVSTELSKTAPSSDWVYSCKMPMYPIDFSIGVGEKTSTIHVKIWGKKDHKVHADLAAAEYFCYCCHDGAKVSLIFSRKSLTYENIAHEVQHAVIAGMRWIESPMCKETGEQMAYMCGWLFEKTMAQLRKHNEQIT